MGGGRRGGGGGVTKLLDTEYFGRGILRNAERLILRHLHIQQLRV